MRVHNFKNDFTMRAFLFFLLIFSLFSACKSAQTKYKEKNYAGAFEDALKDLKKGKNKKDNLPLLNKSLNKITATYKSSYGKYSSLTTLEQKAKVADGNIDLVDRFDRAKSYIIADSFFNQKDLLLQNKVLKAEVGNLFLTRGTNELSELKSTNKKSVAHQALIDIEMAEKYLGHSAEISKIKEEIFQYGTVFINVEVEQWGGSYSLYEIDRVFRNVESYKHSNRMIEIFYESKKNKNQLDCNVEIRLSSIDYAENIRSSNHTYSESVPDGYEIKKDDKGNDIKVQKYTTVSGTVQTNTRTLRATCNIQTDIDAYSDNCKWSENSWTRYVETNNEEYRLSGDLRAIPSQYRNQPTNRMKSKSDLSDELLADIYNVFVQEYLR
jgi:hypothetical protein